MIWNIVKINRVNKLCTQEALSPSLLITTCITQTLGNSWSSSFCNSNAHGLIEVYLFQNISKQTGFNNFQFIKPGCDSVGLFLLVDLHQNNLAAEVPKIYISISDFALYAHNICNQVIVTWDRNSKFYNSVMNSPLFF